MQIETNCAQACRRRNFRGQSDMRSATKGRRVLSDRLNYHGAAGVTKTSGEELGCQQISTHSRCA
ncbi:MAG TPA: hypothetical protein VHK27_00835, partial [Gammaproteobacteria bacterium]|nr:hypothetical protein [Gammaproteobacteria bacterium]